jgi:DNA-directed RNA polymerase specialized sigma24 family protein
MADATDLEGWVQDELVHQAQAGDAEVFDLLARLAGDRCLAIAVRILRDINLAEDAVQAALITAWTELRSLRDLSHFEPWLHRILSWAWQWCSGLRVAEFRSRYAGRRPGRPPASSRRLQP